MLVSLHKNATTTPATRLAIQQAHDTEAELAQRFSGVKLTIRKWRKRSSVEDVSRTPHCLHTTLNDRRTKGLVSAGTPQAELQIVA